MNPLTQVQNISAPGQASPAGLTTLGKSLLNSIQNTPVGKVIAALVGIITLAAVYKSMTSARPKTIDFDQTKTLDTPPSARLAPQTAINLTLETQIPALDQHKDQTAQPQQPLATPAREVEVPVKKRTAPSIQLSKAQQVTLAAKKAVASEIRAIHKSNDLLIADQKQSDLLSKKSSAKAQKAQAKDALKTSQADLLTQRQARAASVRTYRTMG